VPAKGAPGGDEHTIAVRRWDECRCVAIAERMQGCTKSRCRRASAIFGKNHDIGVVTLQRVGNSGQSGTAALSDVPREQPHSPTLPVSGSGGKLADIKRRDTGRDRYSLDTAKPIDSGSLSELTGSISRRNAPRL
jgi:hypothetical protein